MYVFFCVIDANFDRVVRDGKTGGEARSGHLGEGTDDSQADERGDHPPVQVCCSKRRCIRLAELKTLFFAANNLGVFLHHLGRRRWEKP